MRISDSSNDQRQSTSDKVAGTKPVHLKSIKPKSPDKFFNKRIAEETDPKNKKPIKEMKCGRRSDSFDGSVELPGSNRIYEKWNTISVDIKRQRFVGQRRKIGIVKNMGWLLDEVSWLKALEARIKVAASKKEINDLQIRIDVTKGYLVELRSHFPYHHLFRA